MDFVENCMAWGHDKRRLIYKMFFLVVLMNETECDVSDFHFIHNLWIINFVDHIDKNASNIQLTGFNPTETKIMKLRIRKAQKFWVKT